MKRCWLLAWGASALLLDSLAGGQGGVDYCLLANNNLATYCAKCDPDFGCLQCAPSGAPTS